MGLFRKVESGIERAFGGLFGRTFNGNVEPAELAAKLIKEMEDHKVASVSRVYAPNKFTIFLCVDDRRRMRSYEASLGEELASHVLQHARGEGLSLVGPPQVEFKTDTDLKLGQFGILAEMDESANEPARPEAVAGAEEAFGPFSPQTETAPEPEAEEEASHVQERRDIRVLPISPGALDTQDIPMHVAEDLDLARNTIILREGSRVAEFHKGRVLLGRAKAADFQLDDPNVSRQHAAIYWEQGRLFVKDLGSTNGTLLNGKPVTAGPLSSGDVLTLGDTEVTVKTG